MLSTMRRTASSSRQFAALLRSCDAHLPRAAPAPAPIYGRHFTEGRRDECIPVRDDTVVMGIEYSADDTGVALVDRHGNVLGESLKSQLLDHRPHGGIFPGLAQECHEKNLPLATDEALASAGLTMEDVSAIAYTKGPGLPFSLGAGMQWVTALRARTGKPLLPVHHLHAHALTARLHGDGDARLEFPFLVLLASGGNCMFAVAEGVSDFKLLGAKPESGWSPGKVLDRVAHLLRLSKAPELEQLCPGAAMEAAARGGDPLRFPFTWTDKRHGRTAASDFAPFFNQAKLKLVAMDDGEPSSPVPNYKDFAASFQAHLFQYLTVKLEHAVVFAKHRFPAIRHLVASGGVAANQHLRRLIGDALRRQGVPWRLVVPPPPLCTDNGVMIAWAGMEYLAAGVGPLHASELPPAVGLRYHPRLPFGDDISDEYRPLARRIRRQPIAPTDPG